MPAPDAITCDKLAKLIGTARCPAVLDVRQADAKDAEPRLVPSARWLDEDGIAPASLTELARDLDRQVVVLCVEGHGRSQGVAAWLRHEGVATEYLEDGMAAWLAAGLPLVTTAKITGHDPQGRSLWVTRARPKISRIACPWLIRRFIDPQAVFLFVAPAEVPTVAERFGAMPFDIEGVFWSHRGEDCTFDVLLKETRLSIPTLDRLALIVRGADTARVDLAPQVASLLAASLGLSRMYSDDLEQLNAGLQLYDVFYRWARDATAEVHNWPTNTGPSAT